MAIIHDGLYKDLLIHVVDGLAHADLLLGEPFGGSVAVKPVKLVVVEVFAKADVVYRVGEKSFELFGDVDPGLAVHFDVGQPPVALDVEVLFEHADHGPQALLVKHVGDGLACDRPVVVGRHEGKEFVDKGPENLGQNRTLVDVLLLLRVIVLHCLGVSNHCQWFPGKVNHDHGVFGRVVGRHVRVPVFYCESVQGVNFEISLGLGLRVLLPLGAKARNWTEGRVVAGQASHSLAYQSGDRGLDPEVNLHYSECHHEDDYPEDL